jgi:hypothetical protein
MTSRQGLPALMPVLMIAALVFVTPSAAQGQRRERVPAAPGAPAASPIAFGGGWQVVVNRTESYTLVLQIANPTVNPLINDLYVTGQLIRTDGATQYNGTVQGVIPRATSTLNFSFAQPGANRGGTGVLMLSADGNAITGNSKAGEVYSTWRGTRAK